MALVVVYDACVLYPAPLRDLLLRVAVAGLVQAKWTDEILDECFENIAVQRPELAPERLRRTRALMIQAVPDCLVSGHKALIGGLVLPDPDDRHVLAAAIHAGAQVIVTANLKDFPADTLAGHGVTATHPDAFLHDLADVAPGVMARVVAEQTAALRSPPTTVVQLLETLRDLGLVRTTTRLRARAGT